MSRPRPCRWRQRCRQRRRRRLLWPLRCHRRRRPRRPMWGRTLCLRLPTGRHCPSRRGSAARAPCLCACRNPPRRSRRRRGCRPRRRPDSRGGTWRRRHCRCRPHRCDGSTLGPLRQRLSRCSRRPSRDTPWVRLCTPRASARPARGSGSHWVAATVQDAAIATSARPARSRTAGGARWPPSARQPWQRRRPPRHAPSSPPRPAPTSSAPASRRCSGPLRPPRTRPPRRTPAATTTTTTKTTTRPPRRRRRRH
mmetsp:Transcript_61820/g.177298  ORF Transcript_61820/g.177298 Transcript_61820/m.177298 type:complete len:253 (-) Transcript_61820:363-1121(-)